MDTLLISILAALEESTLVSSASQKTQVSKTYGYHWDPMAIASL